uniref:Uncharacterized protein n=1 Tax=Bionectria ochroleuca TaxID=29856 RepID=A0A0B7K6M7_BIOOC
MAIAGRFKRSVNLRLRQCHKKGWVQSGAGAINSVTFLSARIAKATPEHRVLGGAVCSVPRNSRFTLPSSMIITNELTAHRMAASWSTFRVPVRSSSPSGVKSQFPIPPPAYSLFG